MYAKPSYVSTVSLVPSEMSFRDRSFGDIYRSSNFEEFNASPSTPTSGGFGSPGVVGEPNPFRITNIRMGSLNDELDQAQYIRDEEARAAKRTFEERKQWSWSVTAWNVVACVLCPISWYCTFGALLCNIFAYVDHRSNDLPGERAKLRCALWWSIIGFTAGVIGIVVILIVLFVVYGAQNWNSIPTVPGSDFTM